MECQCPSTPTPAGTGRVALAFLSLGYSPLAKDEIANTQVGRLMDASLSFLQTRQREDGALYPDDPNANAWAAWTLAEAQSLTGSNRWRDSARRAVEFAQGMPATDDTTCLIQTAARLAWSPKGPEPRFHDQLRRAVTARWWGKTGAPAPKIDPRTASAEDIELGDMLFRNDGHKRSEHRAWAAAVVEGVDPEHGGGRGSSVRGPLLALPERLQQRLRATRPRRLRLRPARASTTACAGSR